MCRPGRALSPAGSRAYFRFDASTCTEGPTAMTSQQDDLGREANRRYWQTEEPVTEMADALGVSRGTLYNHISPLSTGGVCEECGGALAYRNRQNRDTGEAECVECGTAQHQERTAAAAESGPPRRSGPAPRRTATPAGTTDEEAERMLLFGAVVLAASLMAAGIALMTRRSS